MDPLRLIAEVSECLIGLSISLQKRDDVTSARKLVHVRTEERDDVAFGSAKEMDIESSGTSPLISQMVIASILWKNSAATTANGRYRPV
jgi:hypothetical protein